MNKTILAVVGLPGSGKSETSKYIIEKTNWGHVHFGNTVVDEIAARGLEPNQANERVVREELRARLGMAAMAIINLPKVKELFEQGNIVIESLYSWEEFKLMKEEFGDNFLVLAITARFDIRANRMAQRPFRPLTGEELNDRDYTQIETLHQAGPIARADFTVVNEGTQEELYEKLNAILKVIKESFL